MTVRPPRALAPDLARGAMLLAIAFAHAPLFVLAVDHGPALANGVSLAFHDLFVHNHARPMFAFLFGYALVQTLDRRTARGDDPADVRSMLRRRGLWLLVFGLVHLLLAPIDILAGSDKLRGQIETGTPLQAIVASWRSDEEGFEHLRRPYLMY